MPEWTGADRKRRIVTEDNNGGWLAAPLPAGELAEIDTSVAHPARVYDYWLGGKDNFAADREAGDRVLAATPGLRDRVRANRGFLARRYNERVSTPQTLRTRAEVSRFFERLDLVPPGLVYVHSWRPGPDDIVPPNGVSAYGGVARKP